MPKSYYVVVVLRVNADSARQAVDNAKTVTTEFIESVTVRDVEPCDDNDD